MATTPKTPDQIRLEGMYDALPAYVRANEQIVNTNTKQHAESWRAAASAVARLEAAKHSGESRAMIEASVELAKIRTVDNPVDREIIARLEQEARTKNPGMKPHDEHFRQYMWQRFSEEFASPESNPRTLGTFRVMQDKYPWSGATLITEENGVAWENYQRIVKMAEIQAGEAERMKEVHEQAGNLADYLRQHPNAEPTELQQYMDNLPYLGDSAAMADVAKFASAQADVVPELKGAAKTEYDRNEAVKRMLEKNIIGESAESERDRMARLINKPGFQWWAEQNGFDIGSVRAAVEGEDHGPGVVTPVGVYAPGPDDKEAIKLFMGQTNRRDNQDMPWQHRKYKGEAPVFGQVTVKYGAAPAADKIDGAYYFSEGPDGTRTYLQPAAMAAKKKEAAQAYARAALKEAGEANPTEEQVQAMAAQVDMAGQEDEFLKDVGVQKSSDAPSPQQSQVLTGKFRAARAGDKRGSLRILTADGVVVVPPDQMVGKPRVTGGGGDPQTLARFFEVVAGRTAANKEEKIRDRLETEPDAGAPKEGAENAARALVKERSGAADAGKLEDRRYQMEQERRRKAETIAEDADRSGRPVAAIKHDVAVAEDTSAGSVASEAGMVDQKRAEDTNARATRKALLAGEEENTTTRAKAAVRSADEALSHSRDARQMTIRDTPVTPSANRAPDDINDNAAEEDDPKEVAKRARTAGKKSDEEARKRALAGA